MTSLATRIKNKRLEELARLTEKVVDGDRLFFERHPTRNYRIRNAAACEIEAHWLQNPNYRDLDAGEAFFVAVRQIAPGRRVRALLHGPADNDVDVPDAEAARAYGIAISSASESAKAVEDALRDLEGGR